MIKKLRFRMTLLVICVLVAVSAGIVIAINEVNNRYIVDQVESALSVLKASEGVRPTKPSGTHQPSRSKAEDTEEGDGSSSSAEDAEAAGETGEDASEEESSSSSGEKPGSSGQHDTEASDEASSSSSRKKPDSSGDGRHGGNPPSSRPGSSGSRSLSGEEVASLSNYYTIKLNGDGVVKSWSSDREDIYDDNYMQWVADEVLEHGVTSGRIGTQFYELTDQEDGQLLIVLDARLEILAGERVLTTTVIVAGVACLLLSFGAWLLIRRMVHPVEDAFRKQQQFVWDASHELKTPLAVIKANADVLEGEIGGNEYLGYIRSEVSRADNLVKNLLTLARMDRGTIEREMTAVDLSEAMLSVILPFESTVYEAGKSLESEIPPDVKVTGNMAMLQQLTVILLSNALKYSNEHGTIRVSLEKKGHGCEIRVSNTGEGIGPEDLARIFDRFYRTDASRNSETGGEGLGLAIAESIVRIHRGKIRAESDPGQWTSFIVTLP